MKDIIYQVHKSLLKNRKTVSTAESCTGGLLSTYLTQISGSSQYFIAGVVPYCNKIKEKVLKIPPSIIAKNGAVSQETALTMARNIRKIAETDFGISITGIAGPTGATSKKKVGTVFIALDTKNSKICKKFIFKGKRLAIKKKAALKALELLYENIHCH